LVLNDEVRVPVQLFKALRQPDVLVVYIGHSLIVFGIAANPVPKGKLQLSHSGASESINAW
jgi:hypothetical protein